MRQRRFQKRKAPREIFLVVCEGETEREYVETLKLFYRLPVAIKTKVSGNKINQRLVAQYKTELGIGKDDNCKIFFIYDADVDEIVDKLSDLDGTLILSNPCIELWYLLHIKEFHNSKKSSDIVKELISSHSKWVNYHKGKLMQEQSNILIGQRMIASERANRLAWPKNPSSNMHIFIAALEDAKNC